MYDQSLLIIFKFLNYKIYRLSTVDGGTSTWDGGASAIDARTTRAPDMTGPARTLRLRSFWRLMRLSTVTDVPITLWSFSDLAHRRIHR